jgi:CBS domain-containing protein
VKTIRQLLESKGRDIWSIDADATVYDAIKLMAERGIGALIVMDNSRPAGIISERDYARKIILKGRSSRETAVRDIMTGDIIYADADQSVEGCMALMTDKRIRHLPILDEGELIAVISIGDLVKSIIAEQKFVIEQLESYING